MARTVEGRAARIFSAGIGWKSPIPHHPDALAGREEVIHRLLHRTRGGARRQDHALRVRRTVVVRETVSAARPGGELHP